MSARAVTKTTDLYPDYHVLYYKEQIRHADTQRKVHAILTVCDFLFRELVQQIICIVLVNLDLRYVQNVLTVFDS